jgi:putative transposase
MTSVLISLLLTLRGLVSSRIALHLEVLALRHQLQVLQRSRPRRLRLMKADRWLWAWLSTSWPAWRMTRVIVKPETVLAWHRQDSAGTGAGRVAAESDDRASRATSAF